MVCSFVLLLHSVLSAPEVGILVRPRRKRESISIFRECIEQKKGDIGGASQYHPLQLILPVDLLRGVSSPGRMMENNIKVCLYASFFFISL
jgi:hypothetical protein